MKALIKRNDPEAYSVTIELPINKLDAVKATHVDTSFKPEHVDAMYNELIIVSTSLPIKQDLLENINFNQLSNLAHLIEWYFDKADRDDGKDILKNIMNENLENGITEPLDVIVFAKIMGLVDTVSEIVNIQYVYGRIRDFMQFHGNEGLNEIQKYLQKLDFDTTQEYFIEVDGSYVTMLTKNDLKEIVQDMMRQLI